MALTEQRISDTDIARIYRDTYGAIRFSDLDRKFALRVIECFLAALPKPEPVGHYMGEHKDGSDCVYLYRDIKKNQMLYTESPIAPPASEQKPIAWVTTNDDGDYAMLFFEQQEARSYSGGDEPIGLAPVSASALLPEQENYKAQRDALLEELEKAAVAFWKLDNADIHAQEAESAIASVKGGE